MQHHFAVYFDTDTRRWTVESDPTGFFDGSVWDEDSGWRWPLDGTETDLDNTLYNDLVSTLQGVNNGV